MRSLLLLDFHDNLRVVNVSSAVLFVGKVVSMSACVFFLAVWLKLPP